ncbi:ester cyclase [Cyanobacteria bacterium FACHB-502]|nr:ester cyclase [Cyanobacteria bacterium FACHB-502]
MRQVYCLISINVAPQHFAGANETKVSSAWKGYLSLLSFAVRREGIVVSSDTRPDGDSKRLVRDFVDVINRQDWGALDHVVSPDFVRHSAAAGLQRVASRDDLKRFLQAEYVTFPDAHESRMDLVAEGDRVAARHRFTGTQHGSMGPYPPSNRSMTSDYIAIYRIANRRIVEAWVEWDNLSGLVQLGHFRAPA